MEKIQLMQGDCLELMKGIADKSVDNLLCDLPYGTTACKWDTVIPFEPLWDQYERVIKHGGAIVLTASQPFTTKLIASNFDWFKYELIWNKVLPTGFAIAKIQPMKQHENVLVFGKGKVTYNPQMTPREKPRTYNRTHKKYEGSENLQKHDGKERTLTRYYPRSLIEFSNADNKSKVHPTQKPVALFEYLIKTYTNEGETVLDNCMGSGSTGVACLNTNRRFIGIELDETYFNIAKERIYATARDTESN
jgi:site-specific DNA-methyltransferase (adenine-specific)